VAAAQRRAYEIVRRIHWPGAQYRRDIGYRAIAREAQGHARVAEGRMPGATEQAPD